MREIKFRIWDGHTKSFFDTPDTHYQPKLKIDESGIMSFETKDELYEIQQFTGLLDKNGKEIYEGDIVGGTLDDGTTGASPVFWGYNCYQPFSYLNCRGNDLEVIGNIYEHEFLLKNN